MNYYISSIKGSVIEGAIKSSAKIEKDHDKEIAQEKELEKYMEIDRGIEL